jgi:hypothetical protein
MEESAAVTLPPLSTATMMMPMIRHGGHDAGRTGPFAR